MVVPAVVPFELSAATQHLTRQLEGNPTLDAHASQEKIVKRIQELEQEICILKGYHNTTTPICRLPPEIISAIFELLLTESAQIYVPYRTRLSADVVRVTHVCRHWRQVALNCTHLWDNLDFAFPALTHAMLDRSKDAPLTLHYNMYSAPKTCRNFLEVLRRLRIEARPIDDLFVSYVYDLPWRELPLYEPTILKKLVLYAAPGSTRHRPSLAQLRQALITMPRLEGLRLGSFLPLEDPGDDGSQAAPPITFSNLRYVTLTDGPPPLTCFFRNVRFPAGITLHLSISQTNEKEENTPFLNITHLISKLSLGNTPQVRTPISELVISESHYEIYSVASPSNNFVSVLTLTLEDSVGAHIATDYLDSFATILDFSTLTSLLVIFESHPVGTWDKDAWTCLGQAPNLKVITFQKSHFRGFLGALGQQGLFPSLSTIRFVSVNPAEDDIMMGVDGFIGRLISALNSRAESGNLVKRLRLRKVSGLYEGDVQRIQEGVPSLEVLWDGYTSDVPPSEWGEDDRYDWGDPKGKDIPPSSS